MQICIKSRFQFELVTAKFSSVCPSNYHETQRYGKRAEGLANIKNVKRATYINQIQQMQQQ